ncbi:MAG: GGDEF domain-containing protein, partial [Sphaerochaetaceae bacterium]|nr:GGDEF domain-containing protein [Sphaerochaetaceae bacterium]
RGLLLFIVDLSNNEHLLLSIVTYVPFLISALYGASDYMKMERSYMRSKEIEEYAYQDILSNCLNRRSFEKYIEICSDDAELGILSFDINGLKNINDGFGHTEGDKLLAHFSLMTQMDELKGAKIFRIGGDEFIAFVNYTDETYLSKLVEKAKEFFSTSAPYGATLSIGYSVKHKGENILQAIKKSDRKMYKDKKENREESLYDIARRLNYEDQ